MGKPLVAAHLSAEETWLRLLGSVVTVASKRSENAFQLLTPLGLGLIRLTV
jgi:hypothetical protein